MNCLFPTLLIALATTSAMTSVNAAVLNGSFEDLPGPLTQDGGTWDHFTSIPGWSAPSGQFLEIQSTGTLPFIGAHSGQNYAELDSDGNTTLFQDVTLAAGDHLLRFFYSPRVQTAGARLAGPSMTTNDLAYGIQGLFSGSITGAPTVAFPHSAWTEITQSFTVATAGTYRLSFAALGTGDTRGALIDSVEITPAAIPIPAAGALLLTALGTAAALRCRQS